MGHTLACERPRLRRNCVARSVGCADGAQPRYGQDCLDAGGGRTRGQCAAAPRRARGRGSPAPQRRAGGRLAGRARPPPPGGRHARQRTAGGAARIAGRGIPAGRAVPAGRARRRVRGHDRLPARAGAHQPVARDLDRDAADAGCGRRGRSRVRGSQQADRTGLRPRHGRAPRPGAPLDGRPRRRALAPRRRLTGADADRRAADDPDAGGRARARGVRRRRRDPGARR